MTDDGKELVDRLRWVSEWYFVDPVDGTAYASDDPLDAADRIEELEARYEKSQDQIDRLIAENERLRDIPYCIWAETRDSEWDEGFNYAVKLFRAALGETK